MTFQCFIGLNIRQNITHKYPGQDVNHSIHTCKGSFSYFILLCVTKYIDKEGSYKILPKKLFWTKILDKISFHNYFKFWQLSQKDSPLNIKPDTTAIYISSLSYCKILSRSNSRSFLRFLPQYRADD